MLAGLGVLHVIDCHLIHIFRGIGKLHHLYAVEALGGSEETFEHVVEREVGAHFRFIEVIFLLLHLLGIVVIVPRGDLEVAPFGIDDSLHVGDFFSRAGHCRGEHLHQQILGGFGSLGHYARCHHLGEVVEAHNLRLLGAKSHDLFYDRNVVVFPR